MIVKLIIFLKKLFIIPAFCLIINLMSCRENTKFELYAIKYGQSKYHTKYIFYNDSLNKFIDFHWLFYLVKLNDKIILIDTGFSDNVLVSDFKLSFTDPVALLLDMGITADMVTDVIITHAHFDHIGNAHKFTKAKIYIQKDELDLYLKQIKDKNRLAFYTDKERVISFENETALYDMLRVKKIGGHSVGSSVVAFDYKDKKYIITGDECYLKDNFIKRIPVGTFYDLRKNSDFINNYLPDYDYFWTFHDPGIISDNDKKTVKLIP